MNFSPTLEAIARALVVPGLGILAADESFPTIGKRFAALAITSTEETRRAYRELLCTTPGLGEFISGVILFDETIHQKTGSGLPLPEVLTRADILPGIKVDQGTVPRPGGPEEKITRGLDGLHERLAAYRQLGARFTKWRAVITIGPGRPTTAALRVNAEALAEFAAVSQAAGLVPIVEPEVLMTGDHTLARCAEVTAATLEAVFAELTKHHVALGQLLLKTGMVLPGSDCARQAGADEVADATLRCLRRTVPAAVPGIVFLSGGQNDVVATKRLNAICAAGGTPWRLTFSFGRALQDAAMKTWAGFAGNVGAAQAVLLHRARCNSLAVRGEYTEAAERDGPGRAGGISGKKTSPVPPSLRPPINMKTSKSSPARRGAAKAPRPSSPLVNSPAKAKQESARLRRGREKMESAPTEADTSIRSSLI